MFWRFGAELEQKKTEVDLEVRSGKFEVFLVKWREQFWRFGAELQQKERERLEEEKEKVVTKQVGSVQTEPPIAVEKEVTKQVGSVQAELPMQVDVSGDAGVSAVAELGMVVRWLQNVEGTVSEEKPASWEQLKNQLEKIAEHQGKLSKVDQELREAKKRTSGDPRKSKEAEMIRELDEKYTDLRRKLPAKARALKLILPQLQSLEMKQAEDQVNAILDQRMDGSQIAVIKAEMPEIEEKLLVVENVTESVCRPDNQQHLDAQAVKERTKSLKNGYEAIILRLSGEADQWALSFRTFENEFEELALACEGELRAEELELRHGKKGVLQKHVEWFETGDIRGRMMGLLQKLREIKTDAQQSSSGVQKGREERGVSKERLEVYEARVSAAEKKWGDLSGHIKNLQKKLLDENQKQGENMEKLWAEYRSRREEVEKRLEVAETLANQRQETRKEKPITSFEEALVEQAENQELLQELNECYSSLETYRKALIEEKRNRFKMEVQIRDELCTAFAMQIQDMEAWYSDWRGEEMEAAEDLAEERIELYMQAARKQEQDKMKVLFRAEKSKVEALEQTVADLKTTIKKMEDEMEERRRDGEEERWRRRRLRMRWRREGEMERRRDGEDEKKMEDKTPKLFEHLARSKLVRENRAFKLRANANEQTQSVEHNRMNKRAFDDVQKRTNEQMNKRRRSRPGLSTKRRKSGVHAKGTKGGRPPQTAGSWQNQQQSYPVDAYQQRIQYQDAWAAFSGPAFKLLQQPNGLNHPDTEDNLFRLCIRFVQKAPFAFFARECSRPLFQRAMAALSLDHRDASESVTKFFVGCIEFVGAVRKNNVKNVGSEAAEALLKDFGQSLVQNAMMAAIFHLPTYFIRDKAEILFALSKLDAQVLSEWLKPCLEYILHKDGLAATPEQLKVFYSKVTSAEDLKTVSHAIRDLARLYR